MEDHDSIFHVLFTCSLSNMNQINELNLFLLVAKQVIPDAGHSANEPGIAAALVAANEKFKTLIRSGAP